MISITNFVASPQFVTALTCLGVFIIAVSTIVLSVAPQAHRFAELMPARMRRR